MRGKEQDVHGSLYIFCLLFKKMEKVQEHDLYLNQIRNHFDFFLTIKFLRKGGPTPISLRSEYSSSN